MYSTYIIINLYININNKYIIFICTLYIYLFNFIYIFNLCINYIAFMHKMREC